MFPITEMNDSIRSIVGLNALFDFYRLVDVQTHEVMEYSNSSSAIADAHQTCHHIWGPDSRPCVNCTSRTCVQRHEGIVKIMNLDSTYFLIYSYPIKLDGKDYALELIKDISKSLVVPSMESHDNVEITELVAQFNHLAAHDSFTHLFNKAYTVNELEDIIAEQNTGENAPTLDLVMIDLDLFKNINDEYGHTTGDDVLLMLSRTLNALTLKFEDAWAARYGGDEFVICAPKGIGEHGVAFITTYLDSFVADVKKYVAGNPDINVSFGKTTMRKGDSVRSLLDRADERMYVMKDVHHQEMGAASSSR